MDEPLPVHSPSSGVATTPRPGSQAPSTAASRAGGNGSGRHSNLRFVPTLLRKNWLLKRKHPVALLFEIFTPVLFIILMDAVRTTSKDKTVPSGFSLGTTSYNLFSPGGTSLVAPGETPLLAIPETTLSGLLLHLGYLSFEQTRLMNSFTSENRSICMAGLTVGGKVSLDETSPYAVPAECEGRVSPFKIAIVPDNTFTRNYFYETMKQWYPRIAINSSTNASTTSSAMVIPSFEDSTLFYDSEEQLEDYITSAEYAKTGQQPGIFGAIVFKQFPSASADIGKPASIEYSVRMNGTYVGDDYDIRYVPRTNGQKDASLWSAYKRTLETIEYQQYAVNGFMTLQTLVTRFVNCMPEWDAGSASTTGACQVSASTAVSSDELTTRLLQVVTNDPATKFASSLYSTALGTDSPLSSATAAAQIDDDTRAALLQPLMQAPQPYLGALTTPFPINTFVKSSFYDSVEDFFPIFFVLTYLHPLSKVLMALISERETRSRELMKILGVKESSIVISWYITYFVILLLGSLFQTIAAKVNLFPSTDSVLLFLFFFLFSMSVLAYGFLVSSIFSKARTGVYVGFIGFFALYAVSVAFNDSSAESSKNITCLLAPVGLVFGIKSLANAETSHVGISFSSATTSVNNFRFSTTLVMFAIDAALYTILGLYLEKVVPKAYGTTEKWYFPLQPSFWRQRRPMKGQLRRQPSLQTDEDVAEVAVNPDIEPVSNDLLDQETQGDALVVQGLRKVFSVPGGTKEAVKGLHLSMYSGQITCLLGHNGAGKTTLISMLTGVTAPTRGDATIHGLSLREDMDAIRESLGICFQHDVLYPELSVKDHLEFYARVKGYSGAELKAEVNAKIIEVGLADKRDTISSALSGGMKRKLSVAISLLGDSSLVFLDEPTSGMDPYSRRTTWEILMNNRRNRVMVLTTHFMDEADILGDRIAIMAEGELRCCGSALFLKNRYGAGYNLTMVKEEGCDDSQVIDFVTRRIPSAHVLSNVGTEVAFQLPLDASPQFPALFHSLDENLNHLGLLSYGISVTTMEEVFIKVAEASDEDHMLQKTVKQHKTGQLDAGSNDDTEKATDDYALVVDGDAKLVKSQASPMIFMIQLAAMLQKRIRIAKRDRKMFLLSLILPIAWLVLGLSLIKVGDITKSDPLMRLELDGLLSESSNDEILLPSYCEADQGGWCQSALGSDNFSGGTPVFLSEQLVGNPPYPNDSPTVFGIVYNSPSINRTDATGYQLRVSEKIHQRAFTDRIADQFGGYVVHSDSDNNIFGYNVLVNTTLAHGAAVFKAFMDQSLYRMMADNSELTLTVNNHPLPLTRNAKALFTSYLSFSACIFILVAFAYFPASIVVQLVREKHPEKNSKHQQLVSGAGIQSFWLANYIFDFAVYVVPCVVALVLLQAYDLGALTGSSDCVTCRDSTFPTVIILFVLFGVAIIPYAYCWSFVFKDPPSSQTYMIIINFVLGLVLMIVSFVMQVMDSTEDADLGLQFIWRLSPLFCLGRGLLDLTIIEITHLAYELENERSTNPLALENAGWDIIYLIFDAILFSALAVGIDYALTFPKVKSALSKDPQIPTEREVLDEDVAAEAERVLTGGADSDVVRLHNLRKVYRKDEKVAVKDLSFGLKHGECFGFLGINGAGKTTTMKMLTGDIVPTSGGAALDGFDILTQQVEVRRHIGYCPQFDALIDLLTVREHLELFAKIKGVPNSRLNEAVTSKMEQLNLLAFENKLAGSLSGGNKRKLSVAIALIGSPSILFLDEPSTGMDPVSRRFMWDVISEISTYNKESTVVLTTHSMEECEALCTRVGIMVGGGLKCLGSVQHLKSRFGDGLMFDAKLRPPPKEQVNALVLQHFDSIEARITREELTDKCIRLGNASWDVKITNTHPTGYTLANQLDRDGYILSTSLVEWWLTETQFESVSAFLRESFGDTELLERQHDACWFKLRGESGNNFDTNAAAPAQASALRLANVFELVEGAKERLSIREYSVSQTSLEQIFNSFASQQDAGEPVPVTPTSSAHRFMPRFLRRSSL